MHGAGNDYIYVDARKGKEKIEEPSSLAIEISDRHFGIGSDGLVLVMDSEIADYRMRMFNADGSEAGMCGNASRCVGRYLYEMGITDKTEISLETKSGIKYLSLHIENGKAEKISVDMDTPGLEPEQIPVTAQSVKDLIIETSQGSYTATCVSMGNPHAVIFIDQDPKDFPVEKIGKEIEVHPLFPEKTNVEFAQIINRNEIKMRVWERGSGETLACGTGSCATLVAAHLQGLADRKATIKLLGGDVQIEWQEDTDRVILTGGATFVFEGNFIVPTL